MYPYPCAGCKEEILGVFFHFPDIKYYRDCKNNGVGDDPVRCLGCKLASFLEDEPDHFKLAKRTIMKRWLSMDGVGEDAAARNLDNLPLAISDFTSRSIRRLGRILDGKRKKHIQVMGYDKETEEKQIPIDPKILRARRGNFLGAPKVGDWTALEASLKAAEKDPSLAQWQRYRGDRYDHHHRWQ